MLQSMNTNVCGDYCIAYVKMTCRGITLKQIVQQFLLSNYLDERDHVLRYFIKTKFGTLLHHNDSLPQLHDTSQLHNASNLQSCIIRK